MSNLSQDWLPAAKLLRPQGRRGELLAEPHVDTSVFTPGRILWLGREDSIPSDSALRELQQAWQPTGRNLGRVVLKLSGVDSISDAEALAGQFLLIPVAELPALDPDTFRVRDLIGCALYDRDLLAGTVVDIQFPVAADGRTRLADAPDLLAIQTSADPAADPTLVPFVRAWLVSVDLPAKRITMHLPPGLLEAAEPEPPSSHP